MISHDYEDIHHFLFYKGDEIVAHKEMKMLVNRSELKKYFLKAVDFLAKKYKKRYEQEDAEEFFKKVHVFTQEQAIFVFDLVIPLSPEQKAKAGHLELDEEYAPGVNICFLQDQKKVLFDIIVVCENSKKIKDVIAHEIGHAAAHFLGLDVRGQKIPEIKVKLAKSAVTSFALALFDQAVNATYVVHTALEHKPLFSVEFFFLSAVSAILGLNVLKNGHILASENRLSKELSRRYNNQPSEKLANQVKDVLKGEIQINDIAE